MSEFGDATLERGSSDEVIEARIDHVWECHGLTAAEIEAAVVQDAPRHWPNRSDQPGGRRMAVAVTPGGRFLQIVVQSVMPDEMLWHVISAWPAEQQWIERHRRATGGRRR